MAYNAFLRPTDTDSGRFIRTMEAVRDEGKKCAEAGMKTQSAYYYSFAGAGTSSLRYAVETILYLKGEGESLEALTADSRYTGWDRIAAVSYASPYPWYFEGLTYQVQGEKDKAKECYKNALLNPLFPEEGLDFAYLKNRKVDELYALRDKLRALEDDIYAVWTPPAYTAYERSNMTFSCEYLRALSSEAISAGENEAAYAHAKIAVRNDPFDVLNFKNAAVCAIACEDLTAAAEYIDDGLILAPEDEGLKMLLSAFEATGGGTE